MMSLGLVYEGVAFCVFAVAMSPRTLLAGIPLPLRGRVERVECGPGLVFCSIRCGRKQADISYDEPKPQSEATLYCKLENAVSS